jgi:hypothetical protein
VCHIPPKTIITEKVPVDIPAVPPPAQATLQSLQQTVNTLRQIIIIITGQQAGNGQPQRSSGGSVGSTPQPGGSFAQTSVTMATQRVFQNNDPTSQNFVDVQYVQQLVMGNNATRSTWTYNAPPPSGSGG